MKNASNIVALNEGTDKALLGIEKKPSKWRMMSRTTLTFAQRWRSYYAYKIRSL